MPQRRLVSLIEALFNTGLGFGISIATGVLVYPLFDVQLRITEISGITAIFTATSIIRGYIVRRLFTTRWRNLAVTK